MSNTSATGGVLLPDPTVAVLDNGDLDGILQALIVAITGIDGTLVRPRWQTPTSKQPNGGIPKYPSTNVSWCAVGVMNATADDGPYISYDPNKDAGPYWRHEQLDVMVSFYGPVSKQLCAQLRDGLAVPQNCQVLRDNDMAFVSCDAIRTAPELFNQQWVHKHDMGIILRHKITRSYAIKHIAVVEMALVDDTNINTPFAVSEVDGVPPVIIPVNPGAAVPPSSILGTRYDISTFVPGVMDNAGLLLRWNAPRIVYINSGGVSVCSAGVAALAATTIWIRKNGTNIGSIVIGAGLVNGVFSIPTPVVFYPGDVLTMVGPDVADLFLADVSITLTAAA